WIDDWLEASIIILPPQSIITYYQPLEKRQAQRKQTPTKKLATLETVPHDIGIKLKNKRTDKQLTLAELAKIIGISVSYLSHIERGVKQPSHQMYMKIKEWLLL
ncbi:MAG TPA: helix-turn-helix transcriptional regulator, partial [Pseudogracilibacillus sp.]|nr:helix-turn-helix transcriptional regulator [Pseudogracilibacillus sp.]